MAKSLKDSMKELEEMNNAKIMSDDITAYSLEAASFSSPVVDNETTVSTYTNTTLPYSEKYIIYNEIIYVFLTIFLYLLKCPQSLILSALRAFFFYGKPHISRSIFLYFRYQAWLKSW